ELPDVRPFLELSIRGTKEIERTYGPVFCTMFIKHALWFIAQKIGEKTPDDIKTLEQLAEYLISVSDKYPTSFCALTYAQIKTENILQGQTGAGTRVESMRITKNIVEEGNLDIKNLDLDSILSQIRQTGVAMKIVPPEMGYKKNEDGSVDIIWPKCYLLDGCTSAFKEGLLKRPDGRMRCGLGEALCRLFKMFTNIEWDYTLLEFNKPYCIHRNYTF
ncbi:MAG: hypothetical protein QXR19_13600, partial [Candidatus Jordarchaeaceae archaeon]